LESINIPLATSAPSEQRDMTVHVVSVLLQEMDQAGIRYCHWKSNFHIEYALAGEEDLDLLILATDFSEFQRIVLQLGFKGAVSVTSRNQPGVFHFLGNDSETGKLINLHAFTRILTGDHLLKSWALPAERLLLGETRTQRGIRLPSKTAELVLFVFRYMIRHTSILDLYLGRKSRGASLEEYEWLAAGTSVEGTLDKVAEHFPEVLPADFRSALDLIGAPSSLLSRIRLGFRFRRALGKYNRYGKLSGAVRMVLAVSRMAFNRLSKHKHMTFPTGGALIALVGPQGTGKSTLAQLLHTWLAAELAVRTIHAGKPPATTLTFLPTRLIPLARRMVPRQTTRDVDRRVDQDRDYSFPYLYLIRKIMVAIDRRKLLRRAFRDARNGQIVISDRYPSDNPGAIDGASFRPEMIEAQTSALKRALMRWDNRIYRSVGPPDLVLQLKVSVERAVERNLQRDKKVPQDTAYVRQRHAMRIQARFDHCEVVTISTEADLQDTLIEAKNAIWKIL